MFEPYPGGAPASAPQAPQLERPSTVRTAVVLMYVGAALNAVAIVLFLLALHSLRNAVRVQFPAASATRVHQIEVAVIVGAIVPQVIAVGLWIWMAWANGRGRGWARIVSAVLFGLSTLYLLAALTRPHAGAGIIVLLLLWLVGLVVTVLIFLRQSAPYYQRQRLQQ